MIRCDLDLAAHEFEIGSAREVVCQDLGRARALKRHQHMIFVSPSQMGLVSGDA